MKLKIVAIILLLSLSIFFSFKKISANKNKEQNTNIEHLNILKYLPENNKLRFLPNALLTPHIGYVTAENYSIFYNQMIEGLEACVNGKPIRVLE